MERPVATNRQARFNYSVEETYQAGIELIGTEVKSLRAGRANLRDSFARVHQGEVFIHNFHIPPYEHGNRWNHEPTRVRKLLLSKEEIRGLIGKVQQQGYTLVPLKVYFNKRGWAKVEIGLAKGKRQYDKRRDIAKRETERDIARAIKERTQA